MEGGPPSKRLCCVRVCGLASNSCPMMSSCQSSSSSSSSNNVAGSSRHRRDRDTRLSCDSSSNLTHHLRSSSKHKTGDLQAESLLDLSAKVVALHIPFARIEERYDRIPEPVQNRIIFWSFPRNERDICMYSTLSSTSTSLSTASSSPDSSTSPSTTSCSGCGQEMQRLPFYRGLRLYDSNAVDNVLQVGFHLSGTVTLKSSSSSSSSNPSSSSFLAVSSSDHHNHHHHSSSSNQSNDKKVRVSITFDRCKITSVTCTCDAKDIFWCQHVVALAIYRIRNPTSVKLRVPISETLLQLDRQQLQKLLQYMIAEHHTEVLPTAQKLADEILQSKSVINSIAGAPDPTSGPCAEAEHSWHLDEDQVSEQVKNFLNQGSQGITNAIRQINALFAKVKEMLGAKDSNAGRMLRLITEQFLQDPRLPERGSLWRSSQNTPMTDKCRILWDQLASLWVCIVLNPHAYHFQRYSWRSLLEKWSRLPICPLEDYDFNSRSHLHHHSLHHHHVPGSQHHGHHAALKRQRVPLLDDSSDEDDDDVVIPPNPTNSRFGSMNNNRKTSRSSPPAPRSIFQRALEASHLTWDDPHLRFILDNDSYSPQGPSSSSSSSSTHYHAGNYGALPSTSSSTAFSSSSWSSNSAQFTSQGYPLWNEPIATSAARVEALRSHGYRREALRLAVTVVRTMKRQQREWHHRWFNEQNKASTSSSCSALDAMLTPSGVSSRPIHVNIDGWIGNLLDPIGSLFDTLAEASLESKNTLDNYYGSLFMLDLPSSSSSSSSPSSQQPAPPAVNVHSVFNNMLLLDDSLGGVASNSTSSTPPTPSRERPRYQQISVPGSRDRNETYLTLAIECALIGLGQQRLMPSSPYAQEKAQKQEEKLIMKLQDIELDSILVSTLRKQVEASLSGGPFSGFGCGIHAESVPMHTFAKYLFTALLPHDEHLAYEIGLRAMRLPMLEGLADPDEAGIGLHNGVLGRYPRLQLSTLEHIQKQQCTLALTMLSAAKEDPARLHDVSSCVKTNVHSSRHLNRIAEEAMKIALAPITGVRSDPLLATSFSIGLQVLAMTKDSGIVWKRRGTIDWIVNCATEVGISALQRMMQSWKKYFTPTEATSHVAVPIMNHSTVIRLGLSSVQQEELATFARNLALECMHVDPPACALTALSLCENDQFAFDQAYRTVQLAGASGIMTPAALFQIARYMEVRGLPEHAYKVALLAVKLVHVSPNGDNHEHIQNIHWTCQVAFSLGKGEMSELIPILVRNIQCAPVLADILRKCIHPTPLTPTTTGMPPPIPPVISSTTTGHHHHHSSSHHYHHHHSSHHHYHESGSSTSSHSKRSSSSRSHCHSTPKSLPIDKPPLRLLLEAAIAAYVNTTHSRLTHISPRHYGDFIEFLTKAQDTFKMSPDGAMQFASLLENMKMVYKGKKKLMFLVKERFG